MQALEYVKWFREYLDYVEDHIKNIDTAWIMVRNACNKAAMEGRAFHFMADDFLYWDIDYHVRTHDLSKFSAEEFVAYAVWFKSDYGIKLREKVAVVPATQVDSLTLKLHSDAQRDFLAAWEHHKKCNSHHWENWTTTPERYPNEHTVHLVCMVIDWTAMAIAFKERPYSSYYDKQCTKINLPEWADKTVRRLFAELESLNT